MLHWCRVPVSGFKVGVKGFAIDLDYLQCRQWEAVWEPYESVDPRLTTCLHRGLAMYACFMCCRFPATHYLMSGLSWRKKLLILRWRLGVVHMLAVHIHGLPYEDRLYVHHLRACNQSMAAIWRVIERLTCVPGS